MSRDMRKGPCYVPILPRHGIKLFCWSGVKHEEGQRLARLFRQAWRKLPLGIRRKLLKRWREQVREYNDNFKAQSGVLRAQSPIVQLGPSETKRKAVAWFEHPSYKSAPDKISFRASVVSRLTDDSVKYAIAHELAHVLQQIDDPEYYNTRDCRKNVYFGTSAIELDADDLVQCWGFDAEFKWKSRHGRA